ncbi:hypothetical protein ACLKA7_001932 [Drosophila subpalustris]
MVLYALPQGSYSAESQSSKKNFRLLLRISLFSIRRADLYSIYSSKKFCPPRERVNRLLACTHACLAFAIRSFHQYAGTWCRPYVFRRAMLQSQASVSCAVICAAMLSALPVMASDWVTVVNAKVLKVSTWYAFICGDGLNLAPVRF